MAKGATSIYDIARMAGVSAATVSNVLNGKGRVSEATRERVLKIARQEGYVPNLAAKGLREAHSRLIGIITPDISNYFYSSIALEVETIFRTHGYTCCITNSHDSEELARQEVRTLLQRQVDALVFVGESSRSDFGDLTGDVPAVYIDHRFDTGAPRCLMVDNDMDAVVSDAARLLARRGCAHVAVITVSSSDQEATRQNLERVLGGAGLGQGVETVALVGPHEHPSLVESERIIGAHLDAGYPLDGIVCIGDRLALGSIRAIRARGLAVGRDVLVAGIDNSLLSEVASPTITSVERNVAQLAERGSDAVLQMLATGSRQTGKIVVPHRIVERESTLGAGAR